MISIPTPTEPRAKAARVRPPSAGDSSARVQELLGEVREEQAAIQALLAQASPSMIDSLVQMDPRLIGYA